MLDEGYPPEALDMCQWDGTIKRGVSFVVLQTHGMCSVMTYIGLPYLDPHCSMRRYGSVEDMKKSNCGTLELEVTVAL
jgi:hypothetical protein